jgi:hypothetical protein
MVTGDAYSGAFVLELFQAEGISYLVSSKSKSEIYLEFLPCLNSGRVELLDSKKLVKELANSNAARGAEQVAISSTIPRAAPITTIA